MADDLDDEWWINDKSEENKKQEIGKLLNGERVEPRLMCGIDLDRN